MKNKDIKNQTWRAEEEERVERRVGDGELLGETRRGVVGELRRPQPELLPLVLLLHGLQDAAEQLAFQRARLAHDVNVRVHQGVPRARVRPARTAPRELGEDKRRREAMDQPLQAPHERKHLPVV